MTQRALIRLVALGLILGWGVAPAASLKVRGHNPLAGIVAHVAKDEVSLSQAIERARKSFPGRLLHGETQSRGGQRVHVVVIMNDDGLVKTLRYDADTGRRVTE
jgi:uncharacterized membrane protein YkoI